RRSESGSRSTTGKRSRSSSTTARRGAMSSASTRTNRSVRSLPRCALRSTRWRLELDAVDPSPASHRPGRCNARSRGVLGRPGSLRRRALPASLRDRRFAAGRHDSGEGATVIIRKSPDELERMARAGRIVAETLALVGEHARPGVTTAELDELAAEFIAGQGGYPTFKGYRGYPAATCISPNSMIVHGIPGPYELGDGDILSVDVGVTLDGFVADAAYTFPIGEISGEAERLLEAGH